MSRARRVILTLAGIVALVILALEAVALATGWRIGVMHETRHQVNGEDRQTEHGVLFNGSLLIYGERGGRTNPILVSGDPEYDRWGRTEDYSGFGVTSTVPPKFRTSDWTVLDTGYRFSRADAPGVWGEHRLVRVGPLVICVTGAAVAAIAARGALLALRAARRGSTGYCVQCGYDLRGGHAHCPECGTPVPPPGVAPPSGAVA